ncbi:hypothetical protein [Turicibacter sanguinis]|uniref:hypothetical protein n=1 Tax=Turicibacter sanguinis TaxID=154288 RepID=UPI0021D4B897|nr:hypothetical protein [Turicibacter sanguinis]MCU7196754.1 hypothetical protein [Turicibacter sanguinis]
MLNIRNELLKIHYDLQQSIESPSDLIERLRAEGKHACEIEREILKMTRIQGAYDSVETALRMLE